MRRACLGRWAGAGKSTVLPGLLVGLASLGALLPQQAAAAGFELLEQSASGTGQAFAGAATGLGDGSETFFNPAGLSEIKKPTASVSVHFISPTADFNNEGSALIPQLGGTALSGDGTDGGELGVVPNVYAVFPISSEVTASLGLDTPFGLATKYDDDWVGRYHAVDSELQTVNINPAVSYSISNSVSVGANLSFLYGHAKLTNAVDFGTIGVSSLGLPTAASLGLLPQRADGMAEIDGDDWGVGYGFGVLVKPVDWVKVGLSYRSRVHLSLSGDANFDVPANAQILTSRGAFVDTGAHADITLPDEIMLGVAAQVSDTLSLYLDGQWTHWNKFNELRVSFDSVQPDSVQDVSWENTYRVALGAKLKVADQWSLKGGLAFDQSPVPDSVHRTPRIPDNDRFWTAAGLEFAPSDAWAFQLAYAHLFVKDANTDLLNNTGAHLSGSWDLGVDIVSLGMTAHF